MSRSGVQRQSLQVRGVDELAVNVGAGTVRQCEKSMRRGKRFDLVLMLAQVMEKIIPVALGCPPVGLQCRKPVKDIQHAVEVGADNVDRPLVKVLSNQLLLDIRGPLFFILLLPDDPHERRGQVDDDGVIAVVVFGLDALAQAVDQVEQPVVAAELFFVGLKVVKRVPGFPVGAA